MPRKTYEAKKNITIKTRPLAIGDTIELEENEAKIHGDAIAPYSGAGAPPPPPPAAPPPLPEAGSVAAMGDDELEAAGLTGAEVAAVRAAAAGIELEGQNKAAFTRAMKKVSDANARQDEED